MGKRNLYVLMYGVNQRAWQDLKSEARQQIHHTIHFCSGGATTLAVAMRDLKRPDLELFYFCDSAAAWAILRREDLKVLLDALAEHPCKPWVVSKVSLPRVLVHMLEQRGITVREEELAAAIGRRWEVPAERIRPPRLFTSPF